MNIRTSLAATCAAVFVAVAVAGPDTPPPQLVQSEDEKVSIELPSDWKLLRRDFPDTVFALDVKVPKVDGPISLLLFNVHGIRGERGQAYAERRAQPQAHGVDSVATVVLEPTPHLVMDLHGVPPVRKVWIYRVIDRDGYGLAVDCPTTSWNWIKDGCFKAAASLKTTLGEYPVRPPGYKAVMKDGYEYLLHPGLKEKDIQFLHETVLEQEKRYAKLHGPVPKPASNPLVIVVTPDSKTALQISPEATSESGFARNAVEGRMFAVPLKKDDLPGRSELVDSIVSLFHVQWLGEGWLLPAWLNDGERRVAAAEAWTGKPLPTVSLDYKNLLAQDLVTLEKLIKEPPKDATAQAFSYVVLFRAGAQLYRDAFAAFLKDVAATGDWEAAQKKHILSLDQESLKFDAQAFIRKELKFVKTR